MDINKEFLDKVRGLPNEHDLIQEYRTIRNHVEYIDRKVEEKRARIRELEYDITSLLREEPCPHRFIKIFHDPSGGTDRTSVCLTCGREVS